MQRNILEYLEATARRVPDKVAISGENGFLTFRQLYDQARRMGSYLRGRGYYKRPVAVLMKKRPETIAAFLGVIYAGCYYVPLDTQMPQARMEGILQTLGDVLVIGRDVAYEQAIQCPVDAAGLAEIRRKQLDIDPIYIVFTSGSTGIPKGVVGCHRSVIDYIENLCDVLKFDESTVFGNQTPLYFDAYLKELIPTLKYGATMHLIPKRLFLTPIPLVEYLNEMKINTLCWVVSALTYLSSFRTFEKVKPKYLRTIAFASEVFPIRQLNLWREALPEVRFVNLYGPTETTGICCYYEVDREFSEEEALPIGQPFPNTEILLLDENGKSADRGEICIRGSRLTLGYYADAERTEASFPQNPLHGLYPEQIYRTGDLGYYNGRGELMFLGRKDQQIKHMGHRIELGEIEAAAASMEGICAVCCMHTGQKIRLFYTGDISEEVLLSHLKDRLPRYMLPQRIYRLDTIPLTPNGKIDRNLLKQRSEANG